MNLHEYQGKSILKQFGVQVPQGIVADTVEQALEAAKKIQEATGVTSWAVKAQIHAGGRGKGGGVKIAKSMEDVATHAKAILGMTLITPQTGPKGKLVNKILIEQSIYYPGPSEIKEFYMSVLLNRESGKNIIMYSPRVPASVSTRVDPTRQLAPKPVSGPPTPTALSPPLRPAMSHVATLRLSCAI